jgi:hypothetical protein
MKLPNWIQNSKKVLLCTLGLVCFAVNAQVSYGAAIIEPIMTASEVVVPIVVPAVSIYKVTNTTGASRPLQTSGLPIQNAAPILDPDFIYVPPDGGPSIPSCLHLDGTQTLANNESCVVKFNISGAVSNQPFRVIFGSLIGTVRINVTPLPNPSQSLSLTPNFINLSPSRTADLFVSNPTSGFVANNVKVMLPAPLAERIAKVAYLGCDWLATGSVCKVTLLAKGDIAVPAVGWIRVVSANTKTHTVPIQIGANG